MPYRTVDHREIMHWAAQSQAQPAMKDLPEAAAPENSLTLLFADTIGEESSRPVTWGEWFEYFDHHHLVFLHDNAKGKKRHQGFILRPR
ncbi:hypothetical protein DXT87_14960 [Arthrobacter sp. AET 35A]|nr:hypothetical protein [Arthrobacter sp. AET 35A]